MFCLPGMTTYRALFDLLDIPYVGNPPDVMALATHKARARGAVATAGVRVPAGEVLRPGEPPGIAVPAVVKPVDADNSVGVALVSRLTDYDRAVEQAFGYSEEVLVESYVELGREVRCGVVAVDHRLVCLPLEEYAMDRVRKPVRGSADKIAQARDGTLSLVAKDPTRAWVVDPDDPVTTAVWDAAIRCYTTMAQVAGITLPDLFAGLLREALPPAGRGRTRGSRAGVRRSRVRRRPPPPRRSAAG